jgi:hypothetical protein
MRSNSRGPRGSRPLEQADTFLRPGPQKTNDSSLTEEFVLKFIRPAALSASILSWIPMRFESSVLFFPMAHSRSFTHSRAGEGKVDVST